MNKLEEYRDKMCYKLAHEINPNGNGIAIMCSEKDAKKGFDAAIALDLPVKFAEWQEKYKMEETVRINKMDYGDERKAEYINLVGKFINKKELYQYWIDNIYKPE